MEIAISQFKSKALQLLEKIHRDGKPLIVLKRGRPLVKVIPIVEKKEMLDLTGTILEQDDDIFSTGERWNANS